VLDSEASLTLSMSVRLPALLGSISGWSPSDANGQIGSSADSPNGKALSRFSTEGLRVWRVVLPTLFRRQSRFLIDLYLVARDRENDVSLCAANLDSSIACEYRSRVVLALAWRSKP
jgi:hypothetical protein